MNYFGDIPIEHLELVNSLRELEALVEQNADQLPKLVLSKGETCLAYDYYFIDMEEEGERLLDKASSNSPGYFMGPVLSDMKKDPEFNLLMELFIEIPLGLEKLKSLGYEDG